MYFNNLREKTRILVIAAHPDDEILGCGGTMARLSREGHEVNILILGEGITSRHASREDASTNSLALLCEKSQLAGKLCGAAEIVNENFPDNRFDTVPLLEIVKKMESALDQFRPTVVFTQHGGDLNIDHAVTFRAAMTATRPMKDSTVRALFAYQVASSTEWAFQQFTPSFHPNVFVDISQTLETKLAAMNIYESEVREYPHPRSLDALRAQARAFGVQVGLDAAEAFCLIRNIL